MLATSRKRWIPLPIHRRHRRGGCGCLALLTSSLRSSCADIAAALILRVALRAAAHERHAHAREHRHGAVGIGVVVQECLELQAHRGIGPSERYVRLRPCPSSTRVRTRSSTRVPLPVRGCGGRARGMAWAAPRARRGARGRYAHVPDMYSYTYEYRSAAIIIHARSIAGILGTTNYTYHYENYNRNS